MIKGIKLLNNWFSVKYLVIVLILLCFVSYILNTIYYVSKPLNKEIPQTISSIRKKVYLQELAQWMNYYDEVLTQSARNYSFTRNEKWKLRYEINELKLDSIVKKAISLSDSVDVSSFKELDAVNAGLVNLEHKAIELTHSGNQQDAINILESEEYGYYKQRYGSNIRSYLSRKVIDSRSLMNDSDNKINNVSIETKEIVQTTTTVIIIFVFLAIVAILIISKQLSMKIQIINEGLSEIGDGNIDTKITIKSNDEIGVLVSSINKMTYKLREIMTKDKSAAIETILNKQEIQERWQSAQYAATKVLASSLGLSEATPQFLQAICAGLGWECAMMWEVDENENVLRWIDGWHIGGSDFTEFENMSRNMIFHRGKGLPGRVWNNAEPLWILDVVKDANFPRAPAAIKVGLHGGLAFPVILGNRVLGVMEFFSSKVQKPDNALLAMINSVGSQIGQFMERKLAEELALKNFEELLVEQRNSIRQMIVAEEEERKRIAIDMHDSLGQLVLSVKMNLIKLGNDELFGGNNMIHSQLLDTIDMIADEIRTISYNLMPATLVEFGIGTCIEQYILKIQDLSDAKINFIIENKKNIRVESINEILIYRVSQELLNNSIKHAFASDIVIQLLYHEDTITLMVEDNGKGFDVDQPPVNTINKNSGFGLKNIKTRLQSIGATLTIDTSKQFGTTTIIQIPYTL